MLVALYAAAGFWLAPRIVGEKLPAYLAERYGLKLTLGPLRFDPFGFDLEANVIALRGPGGAPLFQAARLAVDFAPSGLWRGRWTFDRVSLTALQLNLVVAKDGSVNLVDLLQRFASPAATPAADPPPRLVVDRLDLAGARVLVTDLRGSEPATATIAPIDLTLTGLSTVPDQKTTQTLTAGLPDGATLRAEGDLVLEPALAANGRFAVKGLQAASWAPFLAGALRLDRLQGGVDFSARYAYAPEQGLRLDDIGLQVADLLLAAKGVPAPLIALQKIDASGGRLDLKAREVAFASLALARGTASVAIDPDGRVGWSELAPPAPAGAAASAAGPGWQVSAATVELDRVGLDFTDRQQAPPRVATVAEIDGSLQLAATTGARTGITVDAIALRVHDIALPAAQEGGPALKLDTLAVDGGAFDLAARRFTAQSVSIDGGRVAAARNADGSIDWVRRYAPPASAAPAPAAGSEWRYDIGRLDVGGIDVALTDRSQTPVFDYGLRLDSATAQHLANVDAAPVRFDARVTAKPGGTLHANGSVATDGTGLQAQLRIDRLALAPFGGLVTRAAGFDVSGGPLTLATRLQAAEAGLLLDQLSVDLPNLKVRAPAGAEPLFSAARVQLEGAEVSLAARRVGASRLVVSGGSARIVRDAKGRIDLLDAVAARPKESAPAAAPAPPWQYAIDKILLQKFALTARDQSYSPPLTLDAQVDATIDHLASTGPAAFAATLALAGGRGRVEATGTATPATGGVQARVVAESVDLTPLQPLLSRYTTLQMKSGRAGSDLTLARAPGASDGLRVSGAAWLEKLTLDEAGSDVHFLSLDRLDARRIAFASGGPRLTIGEIEVAHPDVRIAIAKDRSVNLARVVARSADDPPATPASPTAATTATTAKAAKAATTAKAAPTFALAVQQVRLRDASVDFSDQSLVLPFAARVEAIDATVVGISNDPARRADVQARGAIAPYGSASVNGNLVPADPRRHTDLEVKFNNVALQPFSPYSATFAGRKVQSGKLWLDLGYQIDDGQLLGKNDIRLSQFTLGEQVESKSALNLPLNLAVSLLTDSKGEINLSVPVRGDLDNPRFSVGDAIGQAVKNTLGRIVSAPFRLIGRLFGDGSGDALARVDFAAGSAALAPEQREKLDTLAKALADRPLLQLVIGAPYDAPADTLALQRAATRRLLAAKLGRAPASDDGASLVAFDDPATRRALLALQTGAGPEAAPPADDPKAYEAIFDRIARQQSLGADSPQILATRRAGTIARYMTGIGIDRGRVRTGEVQSVAADSDGTVDAELTVSAAGAEG